LKSVSEYQSPYARRSAIGQAPRAKKSVLVAQLAGERRRVKAKGDVYQVTFART